MKNSKPSVFIFYIRRFSAALSFIFLVVVFLIIIFWNSVVRITPVGHVSVRWNLFSMEMGENSHGPIPEGITLIWPWDQFFVYDIRLRAENKTYQVVSKDGLHFDIELTLSSNIKQTERQETSYWKNLQDGKWNVAQGPLPLPFRV